ncbi:hypothetical protein EYF80_056631 [Liparis tanakae]|uniref:Uncharacterized protein n=1 Tax=Liparis tanakae TaxID=230148 RepID=A0A4Z2EWQ3_9TELE|nr:hypothetical protein EYF80_056631 [Liparis tanakae]
MEKHWLKSIEDGLKKERHDSGLSVPRGGSGPGSPGEHRVPALARKRVHLSDDRGMPILANQLWQAARLHLQRKAPAAPPPIAPPVPSHPPKVALKQPVVVPIKKEQERYYCEEKDRCSSAGSPNLPDCGRFSNISCQQMRRRMSTALRAHPAPSKVRAVNLLMPASV